MAIAWLSVLKMVPWGDVISHAPQVVDGAKKLWKTVSRSSAPTPAAGSAGVSDDRPATPVPQPIEALQARVAALAGEVADLHAQMQVSSALIKELADQNAQLIRQIESNRVGLRWLSAATALLSALAVWALLLR